MPQKIFRTESQRAASRKGLTPRKKKRDRRSHSLPLFFLGGAFLILGTAEAIHPIPFHAGGGYTGRGTGGTFIYNARQSSGLGVFFALTGLVLLYFGYRVIKNSKKS